MNHRPAFGVGSTQLLTSGALVAGMAVPSGANRQAAETKMARDGTAEALALQK